MGERENKKILSNWQKTITTLIYNKSYKQGCNNIREISLLSHVDQLSDWVIECILRLQVMKK